MTDRKKVLFICTQNSARSIIAEALLRKYYDDIYESFSAGTMATRVRPEALTVLEEIGIDTSTLRSKSVDSFRGTRFDIVVTVCDHARETCPFYPLSDAYVHQGFLDPSAVADSSPPVHPDQVDGHYTVPVTINNRRRNT